MEQNKPFEFKQHPIIEKLVGDPNTPPKVTQVTGYLGKSSRAGHVRLYDTLDLGEYTDVPESSVLHAEDVPATEMEHGGTRLWVESHATVVRESVQSTRTEARFLEGAIASAHLGAAEPVAEEPGVGAGFATPPPTAFRTCMPTCNVTCQRTCVPTCNVTCQRTCMTCMPTCNVTCQRTCMPTCNVTCNPQCVTRNVTCNRTCMTCAPTCNVTCQRTCMTCVPTCNVTCQRTCVPTCNVTCNPQCVTRNVTCNPQCVTRNRTCTPQCVITLAGPLCDGPTCIQGTRIGPSAVDACPSAPGGCIPTGWERDPGMGRVPPFGGYADPGGYGGGDDNTGWDWTNWNGYDYGSGG